MLRSTATASLMPGSEVEAATVLVVARISCRALWLFPVYVAVLTAVVLAGFLAEAVGLLAALLWGTAFIAVAFIWVRQRMPRDP